jgi:hypothetical protein
MPRDRGEEWCLRRWQQEWLEWVRWWSYHLATGVLTLVVCCGKVQTYNHCVQSSTGESRRANKSLCRLKEGLEVSLVVEAAIGLGRSVIEALVDSSRCGKRGRKGNDGRETHFVER